MNSMELFKAFGYIDDDLLFDAIQGGAEAPQPSAGVAPVKQPKGGRPPRGRTRAIVIGAVAMVLVAAIICMILYFTGVFSGEKQVPIYTGMKISSTNTSASASTTSAVSYSYSGDYTGRSDGLDKNNPYGNGNTTIEEEAASTLTVVGAGDEIYYADAGDDIYVTIKFDNPDEYDIVSFVLSDGTNATRYGGTYGMFESGSNYQQIIIKLNVGTTGGIIEYTISEIKYIDDEVNKDVIIGGDTVVRCGVRASDITYAEITDETTTLTSISFNVNIVDKYSLIDYNKGYAMAILYDGDSIIQTVELELDDNSVVFENLTPDTIYQYAIVAYYDDLSGSGAALNFLYKNAVYTPAVVLYDEDSIAIDQTSITFDFSWYDEVGTITSLTLTGGGETVDLDVQTTSITSLLSNNTYTLTAYYTSTNGETASITLEFTTEAKATPSVEITADATQETISYELSITDTDNVGSLTSATLSLNGDTVKTLTGLTGMVSGLLSNNTYTITALYTYDLNDGNGEQTAEFTKEITTLAKAAPSVEIEVTDSTVSSLTFNVNYTDTDGVGRITAIGLYNGDTLVKSETNFNQVEYAYSGLEAYTNYTLKVSYNYDLNDGDGEHKAEQTLEKYTNPVVEITSISNNTSGEAIGNNDTIYITANVNNPSGVTYNSVVINGVTYSSISGSKGSSLYIDILNNGQFAGGSTTLTLTQINCTIDGNSYTIDITENNTITVFINGEFTVDDFYFVRLNESGEYENILYGYTNEEIYYVISLSNATEYNVYSVTIGSAVYYSEDIIMSDDNQTVYILANSVGTELTSISYSNSYGIDNTLSLSFETSFLFVPTCSETVEIYTAEDFVEKIDGTDSGYKYYRLMNNIDLSDYKWVNRNNVLYGVFDGNGHTISGVGAKYTYENTDLYLGLFTSVSGVVKNLTVQADYRITLNGTADTEYNIYVGGIAACSFDGWAKYCDNTVIENVTVDLSAVLIINGNNESEAIRTKVNIGGLCGDVIYYAKDVNVTTYISLTNNCNAYAYIGGLYGGYNVIEGLITERYYIENADVTFTCDINAPYRVEGRIGGLSGFLRNCIVSGASIKSEITGSVESCEVILGGVSADSSVYGDRNSFELYDVTSSMTAEFTVTCENVDIEYEYGYYEDEYGNNFGGEWGVYKVVDADVQIEYGDFTIVQWNSIIENCSAETTVTVN